MNVTQDDVHNWSTKYIQLRWSGKLTPEQRELVKAAEYRHHQLGTSAKEEADALNAAFSQE